jgi:hypothetical protein
MGRSLFETTIGHSIEGFEFYHFTTDILSAPEFQKTFGEHVPDHSFSVQQETYDRDAKLDRSDQRQAN